PSCRGRVFHVFINELIHGLKTAFKLRWLFNNQEDFIHIFYFNLLNRLFKFCLNISFHVLCASFILLDLFNRWHFLFFHNLFLSYFWRKELDNRFYRRRYANIRWRWLVWCNW